MKKQWVIKEVGQPLDTAPVDGTSFFVAQNEVLVRFEHYAPTAAKRMGAPGRFVRINQQTGELTKFEMPPAGEWFPVGMPELALEHQAPDLICKKSMPPELLKEMWGIIKALACEQGESIAELRVAAVNLIENVKG